MYFYGLYNSFPMFEKHHDFIYGKLLHLKKCFKHHLTDSDFEKIKEIESKAFPKDMCVYGKLKNKEELLKKRNCSDISQIDYVVEDNFYFIAIIHYNCIFLSDIGIAEKNPRRVFELFRTKIKEYTEIGKPVFAHTRASTSYKLMKYYERKGFFNIIYDEITEFRGEPFHRLEIQSIKNEA